VNGTLVGHMKFRLKRSFAALLSRGFPLAMATILVEGIALAYTHATARHATESSASSQDATSPGNVKRGRALFNGKGICFYCHGKDGDLKDPPQLSAETTKLIRRLDPKPPDLRNPRMLKLATDAQRFKAVREGHSGTAMLPDRQLTDEDIADLLAYLSILRGD
jgi:mono/diheme cytochrome c family protein